MERIDLTPLHPIRLAGWMRDPWQGGEPASLAAWSRAAAREAWRDARAADAGVRAERIAVVLGTTVGEGDAITALADAVADEIGARGPRWTISTACSSSASALGLARDLLWAGDADLVLAGVAERLADDMVAGFSALGVLGPGKCAPFGEDFGTRWARERASWCSSGPACAQRARMARCSGTGSRATRSTRPRPIRAATGSRERRALACATRAWRRARSTTSTHTRPGPQRTTTRSGAASSERSVRVP